MIKAASIWFLCVLLSTGVVMWGLRLAGKDVCKWIGRHTALFVLLVFGVAYATESAGTKPTPPSPPVGIKGIVLDKPVSGPNDVKLTWTREDGSNAVGHVYHVWRRKVNGGTWQLVEDVDGAHAATLDGFWIKDDYQYQITEEIEVTE